MSKNKRLISAFILAFFGLVSGVNAGTFKYNISFPAGGNDAGDISHFGVSYDPVSEILSWRSTIHEVGGNLANAMWLVLSDGPDPMINRNEYAILYGDAHTGNLSAYVYNGLNSGSSWNTPGEFIQTFTGGFNANSSINGQISFDFSIDSSEINNYLPTTPGINDWTGVQFGERIGIWYHPVILDKPSTYNNDGSLAAFPEIISGFYDAYDQKTTVSDVPEPGTLALAGIGLIGMFISRRRRKMSA